MKLCKQFFILALFIISSSIIVTAQQKISVSGTVTDAKTKETIPGVNVLIKGSKSFGASTDINGKYVIDVVDPEKNVLVFSFVGYKDAEVPINANNTINVALELTFETLNEAVVVGFGTQRKANLTGAVVSVSAKDLQDKPVANIGQALQGVVPNLNVGLSNGSPNTVPSFNIRGGTSISGTSIVNGSPLILIDGIEMGATYLNMMNPDDIENISILKDASASAIYGARAPYGVMLITTKSGRKNQRAKIDYSFNMQWNTPSHIPTPMDSYTMHYAQEQATLYTNGTIDPWSITVREAKKKYLEDPVNNPSWILDQNSTSKFVWVATVNPYDIIVKDWSSMNNHSLNLSGGGEKVHYYISLGYQSQDGMYEIVTDKNRRYNGLMSLSADITDWFSMSTKISYSQSIYEAPWMNTQKSSIWDAMTGEPSRNINSPVKTGPNDPLPNAWTDNIIGWLIYGANERVQRTSLMLNFNPTITVAPYLKLKGEFSYRPGSYYYKRLMPTRPFVDADWKSLTTNHTSPSHIYKNKENTELYTVNAYADFNKTFAEKHNLSAVLGFNQELYVYESLNGERKGILTPDFPVLNLATGAQYAGDTEGHWAIRGAFGRVNYDYEGKYLAEFVGRYDGSSRFHKDHRFKFFPSFSLGYRISEESFMESTRSWLTNLKFRFSWGSLGNQNVSNYAYIGQYGSASLVPYIMGDARPAGITASGLYDPFVTWETATTRNFAVEATLLGGRFDFSFDIYQRNTKDILLAGAKYPAILGATAPNTNSGELKTNGWELSLKWRDQLSNGFRYDVGFTLSDYKSEVVSFPGNPKKLLSSLYDGMVMGEIWGYETVGLLQKEDFVTNENGKQVLTGAKQEKIASVWYPGDVRYRDIGGEKDANGRSIGPDGEISTGDNSIANPGDRRIIGNSTPRLQYGINASMSFKGFDLNMLFQGIGKRDVWIGHRAFWGANGTGNWDVYNNSWTPERTDARYPMYADRAQNRQTQTGYLFNGAYFRLKTISLGYSLPKEWINKLKIERLRFSVSGYNVFEITDIPKAFDPDLISAAYPMMRSIAFGVQIGF